jgi:hypothetical protein
MATFAPCGRVGEGEFMEIMARSLKNATTGGAPAGQSRNRSPLAMGRITAHFGENVGGAWPIDKGVTPSYVSKIRPIRPQAAVCTNRLDKSAAFPAFGSR